MDDSIDSHLSFHVEGIPLNCTFSPATPSFKLNASRSLFLEDKESRSDNDDSFAALTQIIKKFPIIFKSPQNHKDAPTKGPALEPLHSSPLNNSFSGNKSNQRFLARSFSETWVESPLKHALNEAYESPDLIGDFSKHYALPTLIGKNPELKAISPDTMQDLFNNKHTESVESFSIVDCRFPYEYDGGHIKKALNIYTREGIISHFFNNPTYATTAKHHIYIFHCEFSQQRGPKLYQFLRNYDRQMNKEHYPKLYYPEIYILEGGYKYFYENYKDLCEPQEYKPMLHTAHKDDLKHFKAKSKSWNGEKFNPISRPTIKKRNFFR